MGSMTGNAGNVNNRDEREAPPVPTPRLPPITSPLCPITKKWPFGHLAKGARLPVMSCYHPSPLVTKKIFGIPQGV